MRVNICIVHLYLQVHSLLYSPVIGHISLIIHFYVDVVFAVINTWRYKCILHELLGVVCYIVQCTLSYLHSVFEFKHTSLLGAALI